MYCLFSFACFSTIDLTRSQITRLFNYSRMNEIMCYWFLTKQANILQKNLNILHLFRVTISRNYLSRIFTENPYGLYALTYCEITMPVEFFEVYGTRIYEKRRREDVCVNVKIHITVRRCTNLIFRWNVYNLKDRYRQVRIRQRTRADVNVLWYYIT